MLAIVVAARTPQPDILIADDGRAIAVRGADGRLAFHRNGGSTFAIHEWLAADADGRDVLDPGLGGGIACDPLGCIGRLPDGRLVSYALGPEAAEEDCQRAAIVIATRSAPSDCAATVVGRNVWRERGALGLRRDGGGFVIYAAREANFDRPWAPLLAHGNAAVLAGPSPNAPASSRPPPRDATPRAEDLEADDGEHSSPGPDQ